jgi:hypothetical protein
MTYRQRQGARWKAQPGRMILPIMAESDLALEFRWIVVKNDFVNERMERVS